MHHYLVVAQVLDVTGEFDVPAGRCADVLNGHAELRLPVNGAGRCVKWKHLKFYLKNNPITEKKFQQLLLFLSENKCIRLDMTNSMNVKQVT